MNDDAVRVRQINWRTAVPSLRLFEIFPLALSVQCLLPAFIGTVALAAVTQGSAAWPGPLQELAGSIALPLPVVRIADDAKQLLIHGTRAGMAPLARLLLSLLVLGVSGIAVSRAAGIRFCRDSRTGAIRSVWHSLKSWSSMLTSTAGLLGLCLAALVFYRLLTTTMLVVCGPSGLCAWLSVTLWLTTMGILLAMGIISVGWLLSLACIGVDACDGPESLSRGISYVLSRFWMSGCYALILMIFLWLAGQIMSSVVSHAIELAQQAAATRSPSSDDSATLIGWFRALLVETVKLSIFFSGVTIAYVLLRHFEDNVDFSEANAGKKIG